MSAPTAKGNNRKTKPSEPVAVATTVSPATDAETSGAADIPALKTEEIAFLAYSYWEARGCQDGSADEDWLRAEEELRARN